MCVCVCVCVCVFSEKKKDLSYVGQQGLSGQAPSHSLAIPMITLNVICELRKYSGDVSLYENEAANCIPQIKLHVKEDIKAVLETVGPKGEIKLTLPFPSSSLFFFLFLLSPGIFSTFFFFSP